MNYISALQLKFEKVLLSFWVTVQPSPRNAMLNLRRNCRHFVSDNKNCSWGGEERDCVREILTDTRTQCEIFTVQYKTLK